MENINVVRLCPNCKAAAGPSWTECKYCDTELGTEESASIKACPSCSHLCGPQEAVCEMCDSSDMVETEVSQAGLKVCAKCGGLVSPSLTNNNKCPCCGRAAE